MPRFYFNLRIDDELFRDEVGSEHSSLDAAEQNAAEMGRAIIERIAGDSDELAVPRCIEITDEQGRDLLYIVFWQGPEIDTRDFAAQPEHTLH